METLVSQDTQPRVEVRLNRLEARSHAPRFPTLPFAWLGRAPLSAWSRVRLTQPAVGRQAHQDVVVYHQLQLEDRVEPQLHQVPVYDTPSRFLSPAMAIPLLAVCGVCRRTRSRQ